MFSPVERAVLEYAEAMTETQPTVTDDLVESLLSHPGFADACGLKPLAQPSSTPPVAVGS